MSISDLIQKLTPLYNEYRENKRKISGTEALELMWEMGNLLKDYIEKNNIAPHKLFWSLYGKSEGVTDIAQKSYITREFQNRCHRIRRIFMTKTQIRKNFPYLQSFTVFREAMPFLDNGKYKLEGKERDNLLALLNSKQKPVEILNKIKVLQKKKIGRKNPRTQRLHEIDKEKKIFVDFYNYLFEFYRSGDYDKCFNEIKPIGMEYIKDLSKNVSAFTNEGLKVVDLNIPSDMPLLWREFSIMLNSLLSDKDAKRRRRFRRVVPVERIVRVSDMLYGLLSERNFRRLS